MILLQNSETANEDLKHQLAAGVVDGKADALLAASVFHFNEISIKDVKKYLKDKINSEKPLYKACSGK